LKVRVALLQLRAQLRDFPLLLAAAPLKDVRVGNRFGLRRIFRCF